MLPSSTSTAEGAGVAIDGSSGATPGAELSNTCARSSTRRRSVSKATCARRTSVDASLSPGPSAVGRMSPGVQLPSRAVPARASPFPQDGSDKMLSVPSSSSTKLDSPVGASSTASTTSGGIALGSVKGRYASMTPPQASPMATSSIYHGAHAGSAPVSYQMSSIGGSQHHLRHPPSPLTFPASLMTQQQHVQQAQIAVDRYTADLTNYIIAFLSPILPTEEEYRIKEATRRQLERLAARVSPGARLLAFGSMANGFALKNSDMDLCCLLASTNGDKDVPPQDHNAAELVELLGAVIRQETDFNVMPLPKARIPIIKISRPPTSDLPYDISCDIGFENRLALENTRLLLSYAMVDPPRLRTLVLFLKVWTKRRKLNSPFTGTLSSYGYTLMMLYFLIHVKRPAVLPNLQRIPPSSGSASKPLDAKLNGHDVYFYDDVATLRREWTSQNTENVGELLLEFFRFFSKEFSYSREVISIRTEAGSATKDSKGWTSELCIEDPFQSGYNVARTVTKDGLYTIRGEFMRASRILTTRLDRVSAALAELCEEREDGLTRAPSPSFHNRNRLNYAAAYHNSQIYLPGGGFDPRYLRDVTRRYDVQSSRNGFGGSFAFEEMVKGLAQAQEGAKMALSAAMLAPLTQNPGVSPHQSLMRAGLRYDANPGTSPNSGSALLPRVPSSARSEDGGSSSYERRRGKRSGTTPTSRLNALPSLAPADRGIASNRGAASSRTSPVLSHTTPQNLLHPATSLHGAYGIGEAFAYGSEISFGSQRFQLHPPSAASSQQADAQHGMQQRGSRSFSDGINRSKSMPRPRLDGSIDGLRRTSTPLLSEPPSPTQDVAQAGSTLPAETSAVMALDPSLASLSLRTSGRTSTSSQRTTSSRSSLSGIGSQRSQPEMGTSDKERVLANGELSETSGIMRRSASAYRQTLRAPIAQHLGNNVVPAANAENGLDKGDSNSLFPLPAAQVPPDSTSRQRSSSNQASVHVPAAHECEGPPTLCIEEDQGCQSYHFADESRSDLSEETLDELARASIMESSEGDEAENLSQSVGYEQHASSGVSDKRMPIANTHETHRRDDDIRSWAAAQRVQASRRSEESLHKSQ